MLDMPLNIGMLLDNEFPPDLRVENEMRTLAQSGHNVHLLCYDHSGSRKRIDKFDNNITIHRIPASRKLHNKFKALALTIPSYFSFWKKETGKFVRQFNIDAIHVHDLRLAKVGHWIKGQFNIPYILDLHENYPAALRYYEFANSFPGNLLINIKQWERYEIEQVQQADAIIAVIEEMRQRIRSLGVPAEKIFVVPNYINTDTFDQHKIEITIDKKDDEVLLFYSGGFDRHRGLETVIKAMRRIQSVDQKIKLHLVGTGKTEIALKAMVQRLNLDNVVFHGWQNERAIPSFIEACDIGIVPHLKNEHTDFTIPHKLFQYLFKRKVVIVSDCNPLKRLVDEMQAGVVFESGNDGDLAKKIIKLAESPELRKQLAENGYYSIIQKYNWQTSATQLMKLYKEILN